jgi:hypothetical protein
VLNVTIMTFNDIISTQQTLPFVPTPQLRQHLYRNLLAFLLYILVCLGSHLGVHFRMLATIPTSLVRGRVQRLLSSGWNLYANSIHCLFGSNHAYSLPSTTGIGVGGCQSWFSSNIQDGYGCGAIKISRSASNV